MKPFVLVHGFWVTPRSWENWVVHYEAKGHRVIAPACPGFEVEVEALNTDPTPLLPSVPSVLTTVSGARRLGGNATGLAPWRTAIVGGVEVTATPARHGPPLSRPIVGEAIGFALRPPGASSVVWISGDTVLFSGARQVPARFTVDTAVLHLGSVQFGLTGPLRTR